MLGLDDDGNIALKSLDIEIAGAVEIIFQREFISTQSRTAFPCDSEEELIRILIQRALSMIPRNKSFDEDVGRIGLNEKNRRGESVRRTGLMFNRP